MPSAAASASGRGMYVMQADGTLLCSSSAPIAEGQADTNASSARAAGYSANPLSVLSASAYPILQVGLRNVTLDFQSAFDGAYKTMQPLTTL